MTQIDARAGVGDVVTSRLGWQSCGERRVDPGLVGGEWQAPSSAPLAGSGPGVAAAPACRLSRAGKDAAPGRPGGPGGIGGSPGATLSAVAGQPPGRLQRH